MTDDQVDGQSVRWLSSDPRASTTAWGEYKGEIGVQELAKVCISSTVGCNQLTVYVIDCGEAHSRQKACGPIAAAHKQN